MKLEQILRALGIQITPEALRNYTKNTSWLLFEKVIRMGIVFVVGVWLSRYLGESRFGKISYILSVVGLFSELASLGTKDILTRDLVGIEPGEEQKLLGTGFVIHLIGFLLIMGCLVGFIFINQEPHLMIELIFLVGAMLIFRSFHVLDYFFQANVKAKYIALSQLVMVLVSAGLKVVGIYLQKDIEFFVMVYALEFAIPSIVLIMIYKNQNYHFSDWKFDKSLFFNLLNQSKMYVLAGVFASVYMKIDQVMITNMLDKAQNGEYANAVRLSNVWHLVPSVVCASLMPAIVNAKKIGQKNYEQKFQYLFNVLVWFSIILGIGTTLIADWLIAFLFAGKFVGTADVLKIHIWSSIFVFLGVASSYYLLQEKLYHLALYRVMAGCTFNIVLNYFWIPDYGILGASMATLLAQGLAGYLIHLLFPKTQRLFWLQTRSFFAPILYGFQLLKRI